MRYVCSVCGYVYDEGREKTAFSQLPESWKCPVCKASKAAFLPEEPSEPSEKQPAPPAAGEPAKGPALSKSEDPHQIKLSAGQLSALCSNLARGCEKQYKEPEAALFRRLADYFAAAAAPVTDGDVEKLASLFREDLQSRYPSVRAAADAQGDRGTKRICVWGEKVTRMLDSLLHQYQAEGEALLKDTEIWVCTVCGFVSIGSAPPELCPVCKVPAWKFERIEGRETA